MIIVFSYAFAANMLYILVQLYHPARFSRLMSRGVELCYPKEMTSAGLEEL